MYTAAQYTLLFLIYSFLGALAETLFRFITDHQLYGIHGFLHLPIMPIYGFGALIIVLLIRPYVRRVVPFFIVSTLAMTILEFGAHWLIELIFDMRIWDYNGRAFNLEGRVSLLTSLAFGLVAIPLAYVIHPKLFAVLKRIPRWPTISIAFLAGIVLAIDFVSSVIRRFNM